MTDDSSSSTSGDWFKGTTTTTTTTYSKLTASYIVGTGNYNSSAFFNITKKTETVTLAE